VKNINSLWTGVWQEASVGYWKAAFWKERTMFVLQNYLFRRKHAVVQLVEALRYKKEGSRFDFQWCH